MKPISECLHLLSHVHTDASNPGSEHRLRNFEETVPEQRMSMTKKLIDKACLGYCFVFIRFIYLYLIFLTNQSCYPWKGNCF